jgi:apolipoprotein D and lipocalin family protein
MSNARKSTCWPRQLVKHVIAAVLVLGLAACVAGHSGRPSDAPDLRPVASVDLTRYAGRWYEIARYPNRFERGCEAVTADYNVRPDGRVGVTNSCRQGPVGTRIRAVEGTAQVIAGSSGARLAVYFAPIPLPAGDGNYWIVYLSEDYQYAVVGEPSGRYLWFLARTPTIRPDIRAQLQAAAEQQGYDLSLLEEVAQP